MDSSHGNFELSNSRVNIELRLTILDGTRCRFRVKPFRHSPSIENSSRPSQKAGQPIISLELVFYFQLFFPFQSIYLINRPRAIIIEDNAENLSRFKHFRLFRFSLVHDLFHNFQKNLFSRLDFNFSLPPQSPFGLLWPRAMKTLTEKSFFRLIFVSLDSTSCFTVFVHSFV